MNRPFLVACLVASLFIGRGIAQPAVLPIGEDPDKVVEAIKKGVKEKAPWNLMVLPSQLLQVHGPLSFA